MKKHKIPLYDNTVVWEWDENTGDISKIPADNLYITDSDGAQLWNMHDTLGREDVCVGVKVVGECRIKFTTFSGSSIVLDTETFRIVSRQFVK